jgi:hypothetical protein
VLDIDDVPVRNVHTFCGRLLSSTILQACGEKIDLVASTQLFPLHLSSSLWIDRSNHLVLLMSAVIGKWQWKNSQSRFLGYISCSIWHCIFAKTGINITSHDAGYRNKTKRRKEKILEGGQEERKKIRRKENKRGTKNRDVRELKEHINLLSL